MRTTFAGEPMISELSGNSLPSVTTLPAPITEREYLRYSERIKEHQEKGGAADEPELQLILVDGSTYPHPGRFYVADRQIDRGTGTVLVQTLFPNPDGKLRPGLYAKVRGPVQTARGALLIPERAVQETQGVSQVAVVGSDNKITLRTVKAGTAPTQISSVGFRARGTRRARLRLVLTQAQAGACYAASMSAAIRG